MFQVSNTLLKICIYILIFLPYLVAETNSNGTLNRFVCLETRSRRVSDWESKPSIPNHTDAFENGVGTKCFWHLWCEKRWLIKCILVSGNHILGVLGPGLIWARLTFTVCFIALLPDYRSCVDYAKLGNTVTFRSRLKLSLSSASSLQPHIPVVLVSHA